MHRHAQLKRFADAGGFDTGPDAAPESRIQQDDINGCVQNVSGQLLKVHDDGVCRQRHADLFAHAPHSIQAKHRILEIIVSDVFDLLSKPDGCFG